MKKLVILAMVVAFLFTGCAALTTVQQQLCNPTDQQKQDAATALAALDAVQTAVAMFIPQANMVKASAVFTMVQNGACVLLTDLSAALATLDAATQTASAKGVKAMPLPLTSLRNAVK